MSTLKSYRDGLTREAVKALMDAPDPSVRTGRRDMAFLILLYSTAARLDEILSMRNRQLHMSEEKAYAVIIGKVSKVLKKYARTVHESCRNVPLGLHAHQFRHAKALHWLEDA